MSIGDAVIDLELTTVQVPQTRQQTFVGFQRNTPDANDLHKRCEEWFNRNVGIKPPHTMELNSTLVPLSCASVDEIHHFLSLIKAALGPSKCDTSLTDILEFSDCALMNLLDAHTKRNDRQPGQPEPSLTSIRFCQPVFILLGRLTRLYEPAIPLSPDTLEVVLPTSSAVVSRFQRVDTMMNPSVAVTESSSKKFHQLLGSFGLRLPSATSQSVINGAPGVPAPRPTILAASNLFYANLHHVGKLRIEWVYEMTHHLTLDERNRTLRMFRFPSYCALICLSDPNSTRPLNMLMMDDTSKRAFHGAAQKKADPFDSYCREVLISLGIIFGQEKRSRKEATQQSKLDWRKEVLISLGTIFGQEERSRKEPTQHSKSDWCQAIEQDDLLRELCTTRWHEHLLYDYLLSPPARANYDATLDFPFLAEKLVRLQEYMDHQSPNDFKTLIWDRRDPLRFWTFTLAVGLAALALVLNLVQIALAASQLGLTNFVPTT